MMFEGYIQKPLYILYSFLNFKAIGTDNIIHYLTTGHYNIMMITTRRDSFGFWE